MATPLFILNGNAMRPKKFLVIKAWGYGFWSDVSQVLGWLLAAEMTRRTPIVYWGTNSLFSDGQGNAFEYFFEPVSSARIGDVMNGDFWPPKWNTCNIMSGDVNKLEGPFSCVDARYLFGRSERVAVGDFYTGVVDLQPTIPPGHYLHGKTVDELYRYLIQRYLRPKKTIVDRVNQFHQQQLASDFIAMHVRGSDKIQEMAELEALNGQYAAILDRYLSDGRHRVFLMTDEARCLAYFRHRYGDKIIATDCQRTNSRVGIHYQPQTDRKNLGVEVMMDVYLAAKARFFIGNGLSNPSLMVKYLMRSDNVFLVGENMHHSINHLLIEKTRNARKAYLTQESAA